MHRIILTLLFALPACTTSPKPKPAPESMPSADLTHPLECKDLGQPIVKVSPSFPLVARTRMQEGWVMLNYDVADGKLLNIQIEASSPSGLFDKAVVDALPQQLYASGRYGKRCRHPFVFIM
jgi:outer membrane biosynthesis protein TonB